jgi:hypothetical protein
MRADGRENVAWTPRHHGAPEFMQTASWTILDQSPTCCPSPGHLFRCRNPLDLSDFFSLAHPASSRCSATNVALWRLLTRPVWWHCPGTHCLGPKCPCAGSLAPGPQGLHRGEVFYTPNVLCPKPRTALRVSWPPAPVVSGLACQCLVVCLGPKRGLTVCFAW